MARINIFEGSRRIALLLKIIWVIGVIVIAYSDTPYVLLYFTTDHPTRPLARVNNSDCDIGTDGYEMASRDVDGRTISAQLCFKAQSFPENRRLVAYRTDDKGLTWGNGPYSDEVQAYIKARSAEFALSEGDRQTALSEWRSKRLSAAWYGFLFAVGGWIALSIIQAVIGWIVRGFAGIPMGFDQRPEPPASE